MRKVKGTKILQEDVDAFEKQLERQDHKASHYKLMVSELKEIDGRVPAIIENEYCTIAQDVGDQIFESEDRRVQHGLKLLKDKLQKWKQENILPVDQRALVTLAFIDNHTAKEKAKAYARERDFEHHEERIEKLKELARKFNIKSIERGGQ